MDKVPLTLNGFEYLNEELKYLKSNERPNIIKAIAEKDLKKSKYYFPHNIPHNKKVFKHYFGIKDYILNALTTQLYI